MIPRYDYLTLADEGSYGKLTLLYALDFVS